MDFDYVVLNHVYDEGGPIPGVKEKPEFGCIISGPYLEGCRWNDETVGLTSPLGAVRADALRTRRRWASRADGEHPMYEHS